VERLVVTGDHGQNMDLRVPDARLWLQAHRAAAQAVVGTALGARVLSVELLDGPPPAGVVHLGEASAGNADAQRDGLVRLLAYRVAGPIAALVAEGGPTVLHGEPAYRLAEAVMSHLRDPGGIDDEVDTGAAARLLLSHFDTRVDDAAEAVEHLALNVERWVCDHWGTIALVAAMLLRHRRLTGDGARELMPPMEPGSLA
jgi:hypothetical protein